MLSVPLIPKAWPLLWDSLFEPVGCVSPGLPSVMVGGRQAGSWGRRDPRALGWYGSTAPSHTSLSGLARGRAVFIDRCCQHGESSCFSKSEIDGTQPGGRVWMEGLEPGTVPFEFQEHFAWRVSWYMAGLQSMLGSSGLWGGTGWGQGAPSGLRSNPHASATLCFNSLLPPSGG